MSRLLTSEFCMEYRESEIGQTVLFESHCHKQFEMIAALEGDVAVTVEGKSYRLTKNQVIVIPPLAYHAVTANGGRFYRRITVLFDTETIPSVLHSAFSARGKSAALTAFPNIEKLRGLLAKEEPIFYAPLAKSLVVEILYDAIATPAEPIREADDFIERALLYIEEHLHEKILLDDLARHTARSKSSFCHLFEKRMNISPKQYILKKRLAVAGKLIEEGVPHAVAAMRVGYENYSSFYRLLKKHEKGEGYEKSFFAW